MELTVIVSLAAVIQCGAVIFYAGRVTRTVEGHEQRLNSHSTRLDKHEGQLTEHELIFARKGLK